MRMHNSYKVQSSKNLEILLVAICFIFLFQILTLKHTSRIYAARSKE